MAYGAIMPWIMAWWDYGDIMRATLLTKPWKLCGTKDIELTLHLFSVARNIHCCLKFT